MKLKYPNIKVEMLKNGIKQQDLAKKLHISDSVLHNRLYGKSDWKLDEINILLDLFKKDYKELFI
jgi:ribosome-binding protein aMBF1 (putative translation factor)